MPKRKRSIEEEVDQSFEKYTKEVFRALKAAKGFERQRLAKRMKEPKLGQDKVKRLEQEVVVLKSLDLHQAATAHLCSGLLKVKAAAQSPHLPERLKKGVPKPEISEEERAALHNVTSALYKRNQVRAVINRAIPALCELLGVPPPGAKSKEQGTAAPKPKQVTKEETVNTKAVSSKAKEEKSKRKAVQEESSSSDEQSDDESDASGDELDEDAVSKMEAMLGGSSSEDEGDDNSSGEDDSGDKQKGGASLAPKTRKQSFSDDISLPGSDSVPEEEPSDPESLPSTSESDASSVAAPPRKKEKPSEAAYTKGKEKTSKTARPANSTFLPTLMGGYVSGSESASDVDVAPPVRKNRRGQKARQAIWEKKYGGQAKHLNKADKKRDAGWDAKRGAVEGGEDGKPWKRGVRNPLQKKAGDERAQGDKAKEVEKKRDDAGPLHPSWEAKKKAKQAQAQASFQGKKIVFD